MKKILKQVVGIDVAQKELVVALGRMNEELDLELYGHKSFGNNQKGFLSLLLWVKKQTDEATGVRFVMEATGVYHEALAYFLDDKGYKLSIILPNKISNYARTLDIKTVTDKTASEAITRFGLERKLDDWQRPKPLFKSLRQLTREKEQLIQIRTMVKNQLHAEQTEAWPNAGSISRFKTQLALLNKQEKQIKAEIAVLSKQDSQVHSSIQLISSIPGIGTLTAVTILAETNGFELIRNKRQLTSYAGLDVKEKQSGTSVKGKARISKRGNKYLRKALYMPSLTAIRHNEWFKTVYARLISKHGIKMKSAVAIQRKLLELAYIIYKTNTPYNKDHYKKLESNQGCSLNRLA